MSWSGQARVALAAGAEVYVQPVGSSMAPRIRSHAHVLLAPVRDPATLTVGDIVFVKVRGRWYLHRIAAVEGQRLQIANQRGHVNGWAHRRAVLGVVTRIDNPGSALAPTPVVMPGPSALAHVGPGGRISRGRRGR